MKVDYLIVGQGLAGTLLANALMNKGQKVVVVGNSNAPTASLVAAGLYNPLVFKRVTASWLANDLIKEVYSTYSQLENLLDVPLIHKTPICKLITDEELDWFKGQIDKKQLHHFISEIQTNPKFAGVKRFKGAAIINHSGYVDLKTLILNFREWLVQKGAYIEATFNYADIEIDEKVVQWNNITANRVIFCEGTAGVNNPFLRSGNILPNQR